MKRRALGNARTNQAVPPGKCSVSARGGGGEEDLTEEEKYLRMVSALCLVFTQLHSLTARQTPIYVPGMITHVQRDILIF